MNSGGAETKLSKEQRDALGLVSIGTVLEYFDLMLYIHMSVILNELFFPIADPIVKSFVPAFSFCTSYFLRPFGAMFFGYIGDIFGRRTTIILTTILMSCCCITIASLPTYERIGITAPIILTICRMIQGMSASAEVTGVEIYLTETIKPPKQYPLVASVTLFQAIGSLLALGVASIFTSSLLFSQETAKYSWRFAFLFGATIGIIGAFARTSLKEAAEFSDRQRIFKSRLLTDGTQLKILEPKVPVLLSIAFFFIHCAQPLCFYFLYVHCAHLLEDTFGFSPIQVINNNLLVKIVDVLALIGLIYLSYRIHPLKLLRAKFVMFITSIVMFAIFIKIFPSSRTIFIFQCIGTTFLLEQVPATPIFFKYFPVIKRFRYAGVISALAKMAAYLTTSFGLVVFTKKFGFNGIFVILLPLSMCFAASVLYFEKKEKDALRKANASM